MCPLQDSLGVPVLKPRLRPYNALLVILQKHLMKGTWTGRTTNTSWSLLLVAGGNLRWLEVSLGGSTGSDPCLQLGGFAERPANIGLNYTLER